MNRALCLLIGLWLFPCQDWHAAAWAQGGLDRQPGYLDLDSLGFRPGVGSAVDLSVDAVQMEAGAIAGLAIANVVGNRGLSAPQ